MILGVLFATPPQPKGGTQYAFVRGGTPPSLHADVSHFLEAKEIGDVCTQATLPSRDRNHYQPHTPKTGLYLKAGLSLSAGCRRNSPAGKELIAG